MKKYILLSILFITNLVSAQLLVGSDQNLIESNESILINFERNANRGLVLPTVSKLPTEVSNGTLLLDGVDGSNGKIKLYKNNSWVELTKNGADVNSIKLNQRLSSEFNDSKVIIGAEQTSKKGVLVLESKSKAMVLPIVSNTDEIVKPSPGMIVFVVNSSIEKSVFAAFDGELWTYWAAE